jgi:DNA primase
MRIPDSVIEEVSRRTDIVEVVSSYVTLKKSGSRFMGLCPFHSEKTPSFSVNPEIGAYYCFGCQRGGSVFSFLMEMEGWSFPDAVRHLAEKVGVQVETLEDDQESRTRRALLELYGRVAGTFAYFLKENDAGQRAREILAGRGLSDDIAEGFGLGFSPDDAYWLYSFLRKKDYSAEFLAKSGLFTRANEKRSLFSGRIMFPIRSSRGEVVAFGGRLIAGDGPKYINSPETAVFHKRLSLYGIDRALRSIRSERRVTLAEGYMDVLALHQAGILNAVAPLGTAVTDEHAAYLARFCDSALLVFDADSAGISATQKAAELLERHGVSSEVAPLEAGGDPADLLEHRGSQAVRDAVSSSLSVLEYLVRSQIQHMQEVTPGSKELVLRQVFPYISEMKSEVKRRESLRLAADLIGADREAVLRDYGRFHSQSRPVRGSREESRGSHRRPQPEKSGRVSHDLSLMLATVSSRGHFAYLRRWVQPEDLDSAAAREIYVALEESFRRQESSLDLLLGRIDDPGVVALVQERIASGEFDGVEEQAIRDGVMAIRRRSLRRRIEQVETRLRRLAAGTESGESETDLLAEKMHLDQELRKLKGEIG